MPRIRVLPRSVAEKIAAGEVVERPASLVKELFENALDAEASQIQVELEEGGRKLVRVSDNGLGMDAEDLRLAFLSHATSKLETIEDLGTIASMGFRGEALTSIGAVSQVTMSSTPRGESAGAVIEVAGGVLGEPRPFGAPEGTTVEVRNLFYNVPARRKFLRSAATEAGHACETVTTIALAHPHIHFELWHNRRKLFSLPATEDLKERIAALFGNDLAQEMITVAEKNEYLELLAHLSSPRHTRSNTRTQFIYLNRRFIRDRLILHALRQAYKGLVERGRYPIAFLFLSLDPRQVDVNVHPQKLEVRFRNSGRVFGTIAPALARALRGGRQALEPLQSREALARHRQRLKAALSDFFKSQQQKVQPHLPLPRPSAARRARAGEMLPRVPTKVFQVHASYIVAETEVGITIIDQHALHERILYEKLKASLGAGRPASQKLLVPLKLELSKQEELLLAQYREAFIRIGFDIALVPSQGAVLESAPQLLGSRDPLQFVRDLLDDIGASPLPTKLEDKLDALCNSLACKAAVKAGQPLTPAEMEGILAQQEGLPGADSCPHGRPTTLSFTLPELEDYFRRH